MWICQNMFFERKSLEGLRFAFSFLFWGLGTYFVTFLQGYPLKLFSRYFHKILKFFLQNQGFFFIHEKHTFQTILHLLICIQKSYKVYQCTSPVYKCTSVVYQCTSILVYQCSCVPVYQCISVSVYQCISVPEYQCTSVLVYQCTNVPVYQCTSVPVYQCTCHI